MAKITKTPSIDFRGFISDEAFETIVESGNITEIVTKIQNGDSSAFNEIDSTYRNHLLMVAFRKMDDKNYAKDLVQDTIQDLLVDIFEDNIPDIKSEGFEQEMVGKMFKSLTYKTMAIGSDDRRHKNNFENKTVSIELEDKNEKDETALENIVDESLCFFDKITKDEELSGLQCAIESLRASSRRALELSFYHKLNHREIALEIGTTVSTARRLVNSSVEELSKLYKS